VATGSRGAAGSLGGRGSLRRSAGRSTTT
jgi:hypothetical protein